MHRRSLLACGLALILSPAFAVEPAPRAGTTAQGRRFLVGGADADEAEVMKSMAPEFPLTIVLTALDGAYIADVQVRVVDAAGNPVLETRAEAPYVLVDLGAGAYTVQATHAGVTQQRRVRVGGGRQTVAFRYDVPVGVPYPLR